MKIRCIDDSVRVRLTKSDLARLVLHGSIHTRIYVDPANHLSYVLALSPQRTVPDAFFEDGIFRLEVPGARLRSWADSDEISLEYYKNIDAQHNLHMLIEKDFPCKSRDGEDKSDTFWELSDESC